MSRRPDAIRCWPLALAAACVLAGAAHAAPPNGRLLAAQCAQCHGTNLNADGFDKIAGKPANDIYNDLREMRVRRVESIMDRQARGYTDAQLRALANYIATLPRASD